MSTSLANVVNALTNNEADVVKRVIKGHLSFSERVGGGANSRVYRVIMDGEKQYIAKFYFLHNTVDTRDRLGTEISTLKFLWEQGVRCIPQPVAATRDGSCLVCEYVEGSGIHSNEITTGDIDETVFFLKRLKTIAEKSESSFFPPASEANFSIMKVIMNAELRLRELDDIDNDPVLCNFLEDDFKPFFGVLKEWCKDASSKRNIGFDVDIPKDERTLSPSDFGFHNAIRDRNGHIVFLDFEYFGWDDPAKMISDFLLHPAMEISENLKKRFFFQIVNTFVDNVFLIKRIGILYPMFGLKWCLIFLNEFILDNWNKRHFASPNLESRTLVLQRQLNKAKKMLERVKQTYEIFPYQI